MAEIINFRELFMNDVSVKHILELLEGSLEDIEDIVVFYKTKDKDINLMHSNVALADKAVMATLLQYDMFQDLTPQEDDNA
jgi:hypothetical protein